MNPTLSWHSIRDFFKGQWVELIDCEWDARKPFPKRARVRHHAWDRQELLAAIEESGEMESSTIMYIGVIECVVEAAEVHGKAAVL